MNVLLLRTWLTNTGNGFIEKGARALLEKVCDGRVIEASGYGKHRLQELKPADAVPSVASYVDADVAVLPGCVLYEHALEPLEDVLFELKERGIPLILLGVGGGNYEESTKEYVSGLLQDLSPDVIISRDKPAFQAYSELAPIAHSGIDCAYWIDEWYDATSSIKQFNVSCFEKQDEPALDSTLPFVRTKHRALDHPSLTISQLLSGTPFPEKAKSILKRWNKNEEFTTKRNIFISDSLTDYLFFYANAEITYSDRIHACLPTLVYGNKAQFYHKTPRAGLFQDLLGGDIQSQPVSIDQERLLERKTEQESVLKEAISFLV